MTHITTNTAEHRPVSALPAPLRKRFHRAPKKAPEPKPDPGYDAWKRQMVEMLDFTFVPRRSLTPAQPLGLAGKAVSLLAAANAVTCLAPKDMAQAVSRHLRPSSELHGGKAGELGKREKPPAVTSRERPTTALKP